MWNEPSFGQWIKKRRKALDLTQQELARRVGCAVITLRKIEADERRPSKQMTGRLAEHLGIADDERPAFVSLARVGPGTPRSAISAQAAHRAVWSLSPRRLAKLPAQPTPLIGRDQDVAAVRKRLLDDARLLTLVGPPGVGKTRLAIQVAASLLEDYVDGVYFVSLAPIGDPDLVAATIAQTLGVNQTAGRSFADRLIEYLRDKHMLLVLDNFEQVAAAAPLVGDLLARCPALSLMVTSRAPLRVRPERQFPVLPLGLPAGSRPELSPAELMRYPAIALFVERAQAVRPDLTLTSDNAGAIAAICARLDGLPLAIELAAARIRVLPPGALLERLGGRLMLHTDGLRDVSERHRTLYDAIDWSYALLTSQEQLLLARSSVFVGGWTLDAAERMMGEVAPDSSLTTLDALTSLVNSSLVTQLEQGGEPRFTLLETVRAYALERLAERGEEETIRQRHAEYYLALAEEADPHLRTAAQLAWLDRLDMESGNLRAALAWFIEHAADAEAGLRLAGALGWFWTIRGHVGEGRDWSVKALQSGIGARPALRARALFLAGSFAWQQGELPVARSLLEESIALYRRLGSCQRQDLDLTLTALSMVAAYQADYDSARAAGEEAVALSRQVGDQWDLALALNCIGEACMMRHDYVAARAQFEQSLALFRGIGDKWGIGVPLLDWGYMDSILGDYDAARARLEESIAMHRQVGERWMRALSLNVLGQVTQEQGDYQRAAALYDESLDLMRKMGLETSIADVLHNLAHLAQAQGHYPLAARLYKESLDLFSKQGNEKGVAQCRAGLAAVADSA